MAVCVDEAGSQRRAGAVDLDLRPGAPERTDGGDRVSLDGDIALEPGAAGSVEDPRTLQQQVEFAVPAHEDSSQFRLIRSDRECEDITPVRGDDLGSLRMQPLLTRRKNRETRSRCSHLRHCPLPHALAGRGPDRAGIRTASARRRRPDVCLHQPDEQGDRRGLPPHRDVDVDVLLQRVDRVRPDGFLYMPLELPEELQNRASGWKVPVGRSSSRAACRRWMPRAVRRRSCRWTRS